MDNSVSVEQLLIPYITPYSKWHDGEKTMEIGAIIWIPNGRMTVHMFAPELDDSIEIVNIDSLGVSWFPVISYDSKCASSRIQEYQCQVDTGCGFGVDKCLLPEILALNVQHEIETKGCCCGHGLLSPFIQVSPMHINKMLDLGYEGLPVDKCGNGVYAFKPKTILPNVHQRLAYECEGCKYNKECKDKNWAVTFDKDGVTCDNYVSVLKEKTNGKGKSI